MTATADNFYRNIALSVGAHALLFAFFLMRAVFIPSEPIEIRNAIRVDIVGLPEKIRELPPEPKPLEDVKPEPVKQAPPKEVVKEPAKPVMPNPTAKPEKHAVEKAQKSALNRIKAMAALDKIKNEVGKSKKAPAVVAGNKIAEGNALTGLEKIAYDRYFDDVEKKIRGQWNIPQWLAEANLRAQVQVLIDERGFVVKKIIRRSSGNPIFDGQAIAAIESSSPLPPPPDRLRAVLATSGVVFNFPE